jgi:hypothetical protein
VPSKIRRSLGHEVVLKQIVRFSQTIVLNKQMHNENQRPPLSCRGFVSSGSFMSTKLKSWFYLWPEQNQTTANLTHHFTWLQQLYIRDTWFPERDTRSHISFALGTKLRHSRLYLRLAFQRPENPQHLLLRYKQLTPAIHLLYRLFISGNNSSPSPRLWISTTLSSVL